MPIVADDIAAALAALGIAAAGTAAGTIASTADVIRAYSPTEGLQVVSHVFQSVEQEGHWKEGAKYGEGRTLEPIQVAETAVPASRGIKTRAGRMTQPAGPRGRTLFDPPIPHRSFAPILTIDLKGPSALGVLDVGKRGKTVLDSSAQVSAYWYADGLEIWGGSAGLSSATGFGSVFGQRALVEFSGTPFGNYFPTRYLLTFSGYLNPVGPDYQEFRGAVAIKANSSALEPLFCERWPRPTPPAQRAQLEDASFNPLIGYHLHLP